MIYINDENKFPTCLVYAWMFNENKQKSYKQFATFTDERGDDFCKQLEKNKDFINYGFYFITICLLAPLQRMTLMMSWEKIVIESV